MTRRSVAAAQAGFLICDAFAFIKGRAPAASVDSRGRSLQQTLARLCAPGAVVLCCCGGASAADPVSLRIKDHRFTPNQVTVTAGERFRIEVENQDDTPAEFESSELRVEKIVVPGGKISVMAGPLKAGTYKFFDDYHPDAANGVLVAIDRQVKE